MKKTQLFLAIFIIFIMITSVIGFLYTSDDNFSLNQNNNGLKQENLDFSFTTDGRYVININGNKIIFDYLPNDLKEVNVEIIQKDKIYLLYDPNQEDSNLNYILSKLFYNLRNLDIITNLACNKEQECPSDIPIKDCNSDAFYFKKSNLTNIYKENDCVVIEGNDIELNKIADKIILNYIKK